jgi:16S rRNA (cytosine967-C5)-methyltransferase
MAETARKTAVDILVAVEKKGSYGNLELKKTLLSSKLSPRDRGLVTELVYGVLRYRLTLDYVLTGFLKSGLGRLKPPLRAILRAGAYQILYLDRIPAAAACNESVNLAKAYGFGGFAGLVNGVLRNLARGKDALPWPTPGDGWAAYLSVCYAHPEWMVHRWLAQMPPREVEELCKANNKPLPQTLRVNTLRVDRQGLKEDLAKEGFEAEDGILPEMLRIVGGKGDIAATGAFRQGLFTIQGESSSLAAYLLAPQPGETLVDLCSAPGGKTTHLAQLMQDRGKIIAGDIYPHRVDLVKAAARRLCITNIETRVWDVLCLPDELHGEAHRVLLDAPCSGLGVIRRKPDVKWQRQPGDFSSLAALQKEMLTAGAKLLQKGGLLLYCLCTNEREETEDVVAGFLAKNPGFTALCLEGRLPEGIRPSYRGLGVHIEPHRNDADGFYYALLERKA